MITILNIVAGLCAVGWVAFVFLSAYGSAFGSASGQSFWNKVPGFVTWSVPLVAVACIVLSRVDSKRGLMWTALPFVLILAMYIYIGTIQRQYRNAFVTNGKKDDVVNIAHFATVSHDYICKPQSSGSDGFTPPVLDYFLTHDTANKTLVSIKVAPWNSVEISPFGKISGATLETFNNESTFTSSDCVDKNGKTVFDNYKVVYKADQNYEDYHLEKYEVKR